MTTSNISRNRKTAGLFARVMMLAGFAGGCASNPGMDVPLAQRLSAEVRSILGASQASARYHQERTRLLQMGPDLDVILFGLIGDSRARVEARADALVLLADRGSPLALATLESALQSSNERLRSAAILGLSRLTPTTPVALELIRASTDDHSRMVRLNALQSLGITEVETIRAALEDEPDREVRQVARQLIMLAEARGAPLAPDFRGSLRTTVGEGEPQIVFRPFSTDSIAEVSHGDLRIELVEGRDIPLAASATVVRNVVPAFFSPDRSSVVFEADGQIHVVDITTRSVVSFGEGIAPRPIPFAHHFVFLRQRFVAPTPGPLGREVVYSIYRAPFGSGRSELIGELSAWIRPDRHAGESPVRWMVVDEVEDGFVLRGENLATFELPASVFAPVADGTVSGRVR